MAFVGSATISSSAGGGVPLSGSQEFAQAILKDPSITQPTTSSGVVPPITSSGAAASAPKKFFFCRRTGRLDWRKLSKVDLQRVVSEVDISVLQDNVEHITFADVGDGMS